MAISFSHADEILRASVEAGAFPSACLLVGLGKRVLFRRAYGRLDLEGPVTNEQTRYDLASLTKPLVVGMLTLRALESGKLCLWDRLDSFIDAPADKQDITIRQMLTHTAGFPVGLHLWELSRDPRDCIDVLLRAPLIAQPGTRVQYCCAGYILLGQLLECLYNAKLPDLALREIFWPLKMTKTSFLPKGDNIAATEMTDEGRCSQGEVHDENARFLGGAAGNAGVFSTMDDLALFMQMLAAEGALPDGSRYLAPATVRLALRNHTPGMAQGRGLSFYLPWHDDGFTGDLFPPETVGHTGFTGTSFALDPTSGLYVVLLTNRICPSRDNTAIYRIRRLVHNAVYVAAR